MTKFGWYAIGKTTTLESNKSLAVKSFFHFGHDAQQGAFASAIEADDANLGAIKIRQADVAQDMLAGWVAHADTDHGINDVGIHVYLTSQPVSQGSSRCVFQLHASRVAHVVYYIPLLVLTQVGSLLLTAGTPAGVPLVRGEFLRGT